MGEPHIKTEKEIYNTEIEQLKRDLKQSYHFFLSCSNKLLEAEKEIDELKEKQKEVQKSNHEQDQIKSLSSTLSKTQVLMEKSFVKRQAWKDISKKLYSCVLHLNSISNFSSIAILGPGLRSEIAESISEYEKLLHSEIDKYEKYNYDE